MNTTAPHESARLHVTGEAVYIDDMLVSDQLLTGRVVYSLHARARIKSFDLTEAKRVTGVHAILCAKDIPGVNQMGPVVKDEPCLADGEVMFIGQAVFLIAAETNEQCIEAERLIKVEYEPLEPVLDIETAMEKDELLGPPRMIESGNIVEGLKTAQYVIEGELKTGAQEHWYLESQVALCLPGEEDEMMVYSSTQHPSETQALVADVLGVGRNQVIVEVRRMGGAFGGKETQANHTACWAALLCGATGRPVKIRLFRDDDMIMTGKRHRYLTKYKAGFNDEGKVTAVNFELNSDGGAAVDLSFAIMQRAMLHVDNAYYIPHFKVTGNVWKTNLPPNTAMRGFGGPQGMAAIETVVDRVARFLKKDAADIRRINFYGIDNDNVTHYGEVVENNRLFTIYDELMFSSEYRKRRGKINAFNASHEFYKKGIAITPVKFGISFTTTFLNQAGALVHVYQDGTILVNHGGTEMGQGLHTKIQGIAAAEFGVSVDKVKVSATNTSKVANTVATAASSGSDLNGMAVKNAIEKLKRRIAEVVVRVFSGKENGDPSTIDDIRFENNLIFDSKYPDRKMPFAEAIPLMFLNRVSLSATGYYRTPGIAWDTKKGKGKPFFYYAFGMAVTEVIVDILTGHHIVLRTDIVHDVGDSLNTRVDIGQVEGGFIQGLGWVTTEEVKWDDKGKLLSHSPDTYKIPSVQDIPRDFRVSLLRSAPNPVGTIRRSKAVAEPPFMLALSAWLAIKDAISAVGNHEIEPEFSLPATNEVILLSVDKLTKEILKKKVIDTIVAK
jgi:xanthine dehydrogenase large subunit